MRKPVFAAVVAMVAGASCSAASCAPSPKWISGNTAGPEKPAPVLAKTFELDAVPAKAVLSLAVAGWCEISVNGRKAGNDVLSPVTCQPDKRISSISVDVAPFLAKGSNRLEILLGNGWFNCFTKDVWGFCNAPRRL